jgi:hypothetical protein
MPKHEFKIVREYENNEAAIKEDEGGPERLFVIRVLSLIRHSSFELCHSQLIALRLLLLLALLRLKQ